VPVVIILLVPNDLEPLLRGFELHDQPVHHRSQLINQPSGLLVGVYE
jgi:hypothetical protein